MAKYHKNLKYHDDNINKHDITDEELLFLHELQKELNTQDTVSQAKKLAKDTCDWIKDYKDKYMSNNPVHINNEAEKLMKDVLAKLITLSIKREVNNE